MESSELTVLLTGSSHIFLGGHRFEPEIRNQSDVLVRKCTVPGHRFSVINMLGFPESSVCDQTIHAFLLTVPLGKLTDEDKFGLDWLCKRFGEESLSLTAIVFTYENGEGEDTVVDDIMGNDALEHLVMKCSGRYYTIQQSPNKSSDVTRMLDSIANMLSENPHQRYSLKDFKTKNVKIKGELKQGTTNIKPKCEGEERKLIQKPAIIEKKSRENMDLQGSKKKTESEEKSKTPVLIAGVKQGTHKHSTQSKGSTMNKKFFANEKKQSVIPGQPYKSTERCKEIQTVFQRLNVKHTLKLHDVLSIKSSAIQLPKPQTEKDLPIVFLQRLLMLDYKARYIAVKEESKESQHVKHKRGKSAFTAFFSESRSDASNKSKNCIHPMDVQMSVFHHADHFLKQYMATKLSMCQYALPLLVPNSITQELDCPLWTFRQVTKTWKSVNDTRGITSKSMPICNAKTQMVAVFRLGTLSVSKSQLMNDLINERHNTFFHRHCYGSSKNRLLMDGVVEIAWYCPAGRDIDKFKDCVAFCNLHGDAKASEKQLKFLSEAASVNVVLLPRLEEEDKAMGIVEGLFTSSKPLVCLLTEDDSAVTEVKETKFKIGLKYRNQADVTCELTETIIDILSKSTHVFCLKNVVEQSGLRVDESDEDCSKGKESACKIINKLRRTDLTNMKQKFLPRQGKLWHEWSQKSKDLCRFPLNTDLEKYKCNIQDQMNRIRKQQRESALGDVMTSFIKHLESLDTNPRTYFLKWLGMMLDDLSSDKLAELHHQYDKRWSELQELKKKHTKSDDMKNKLKNLEIISEKLTAATFGPEHFLREIGQFYESFAGHKESIHVDGKKMSLSCLPALAAEIMISGHPLELMDGDVGHVPLIWVEAVLKNITNKLGDKRVFVLSVLGVQSTGKSTLLNAMFGLQFAVSAGRCTRGAFMQLLKLTDEVATPLKMDYVLVVDTEGLRALELDGKATVHHDNELATFVIGLGDMTLINIFGENPSEMQDILQIVVQAFMRMKKVNLHPRCVFLHQNVGDITAGEKTLEGKRRLQEKLDKMVKLAGNEEKCDVECFSDIITFDIKNDVKYFAQLWEGSPPMAPPNPSYSENIQDLKQTIFSQTAKSGAKTFSQFTSRIKDLWTALLNENFVFSFKNTLEIAVYRKLETKYAQWTWKLRSTMLTVENKLHNRVENDKLDSLDVVFLFTEMSQSFKEVTEQMEKHFGEDKEREILIQWKGRFVKKIHELHEDLIKGTKKKFETIIQQKRACKELDEKKTQHENELFNKSKELALKHKHMADDEDQLQAAFDSVWNSWFQKYSDGTASVKDINVWTDVVNILGEVHGVELVYAQLHVDHYKQMLQKGDYSEYMAPKKHCNPINIDNQEQNDEQNKAGGKSDNAWFKCYFGGNVESEPCQSFTGEDIASVRELSIIISSQAENNIKAKPVAKQGYTDTYIHELANCVKTQVEEFESKSQRFRLKKEFTVDLSLLMCKTAEIKFTEDYKRFRENYDFTNYLKKKKLQYYNIFKSFCQGGTSTTVFADFLCGKLEQPVLQAVYDCVSIAIADELKSSSPAFSGNRSNLEVHILRSLAQEEDFSMFMEYLHNPKEHFKRFIRTAVQQFHSGKNSKTVLSLVQDNVKKIKCHVSHAITKAKESVSKKRGDINQWLKIFANELTDDLRFAENDLKGVECQDINDFDFLTEVMQEGLNILTSKTEETFAEKSSFSLDKFRQSPDEHLIQQLCSCCWVQCPFCKAICTNTLHDHPGDHQVTFHHAIGINGWFYRGTDNLCTGFCTTLVCSDRRFYNSDGQNFPYEKYRDAGPVYASWSITPDNSELPYWKWFVCKFQRDLESHYKKKFHQRGEIPSQWRDYSKQQAIESLELM